MRAGAGTGRPEITAMRVISVVVFGLLWWLMWTRNQALQATEVELAQRAQLARELRTLKVALLEAQPQLPEPGVGDDEWWRARFLARIRSAKLMPEGIDAKPGDLEMGPFTLLRREVRVRGSYGSVMALIDWIETSTPRMRLEQFALEPLPPAEVRATLMVLLPAPKPAR